jgi:4-amino-4-deoxy-L-arabinose transferase-like glycosyltransferase
MPGLPVAGSSGVTFPLLAAALFYGGHLLAFLLLAATAGVLGRLLLGPVGSPPFGVSAAAMALGIAGLAHLAFLLGLLHRLDRPALLLALAGIHLAGWRVWRDTAVAVHTWALGTSRRRLAGLAAGGGGSVGALLLGLPLFLLALYPPTAFDATLYHLPDARAFARSGALPFLVGLRFPVFPQLAEALFAAVLLLAGPTRDMAVHLVSLLMILSTAALLVTWGTAALSRRAGVLAAAAYLGSPIVVHLGTSAYIEAGLTLFTTAALYALWRYGEAERRSGGPDGEDPRRFLVLAAVFGAAAAEVKYLGLFFLAAIASRVAVVALSRPRRPSRLLLFATVTVAVLLPGYGRILYFTGNPVFPFLPWLFGHSAWDLVALRPFSGSLVANFGHALKTLATLPWDVVFARAKTGGQPPYSPFLLLAVPLLLFVAVRDSRVRPWVLLAGAYIALFPFLPPDSRYLLPILPLVCLTLAAGLDRSVLVRRPVALAGLAVLLLLPGVLYAGYRIVRQGAPPVTAEGRERYLSARLPLYPALAWLNRERGKSYTVYAFFAEDMTYFAEGNLRGDWLGPGCFTEVLPAIGNPETLWRRLRALGAGYLLVPRDRGGLRLPDSPAWRRWFRPVYADRAAVIFALSFSEKTEPYRAGLVPPRGAGASLEVKSRGR